MAISGSIPANGAEIATVRGVVGFKAGAGAGASAAGSAVHIAVQSVFEIGAWSLPVCSSQWPAPLPPSFMAIVAWPAGMGWAIAGDPAMPIGISTSATRASNLNMMAAMGAT